MNELGCRSPGDYIDCIESRADIRRQFDILMTVSISRFFRDRRLWHTLETVLLPSLIQRFSDVFRVWSAGCAGGEEAYSLKIVWDRLKQRTACLPPLEIIATDINPECLERARKGTFTLSSLKEIDDNLRHTYFEKTKGRNRFAVKHALSTGIEWRLHDLFSDPPASDFHIIFLRNNLLTYYQPRFRQNAFQRISDCLVPGGLMIIGSHERIPDDTLEFARSRLDSHIYQKTG